RPHEATGLHRREVENLFDIDVVAQACSSRREGRGVDRSFLPQRFLDVLEVSVDAVVVPFEHFSDAELTALFLACICHAALLLRQLLRRHMTSSVDCATSTTYLDIFFTSSIVLDKPIDLS